MAAAFRTNNFVPVHPEFAVGLGLHGILRHRLVETRPAAAGFVFGLRTEERIAAAGAAIHAGVLGVGVFAGERALGPFLAKNVILLRRQRLTPFLFGLFDFIAHGNLNLE